MSIYNKLRVAKRQYGETLAAQKYDECKTELSNWLNSWLANYKGEVKNSVALKGCYSYECIERCTRELGFPQSMWETSNYNGVQYVTVVI